MFLVAVTGGIGTGKSTVCKIFADNQIPIVDADVIARQVVEPGKPALEKIRREFGEEVFNANGELDRQKLGQIIFSSVEKRKILNEITHPEIHRTIYKQVFKYFLLGHNFIVLELPLLFETGVMMNYVHKIITVTCEEDLQLSRITGRNGMTEADAKKRISSQMPLEEKCEQSHFIVENSGSLRDMEEQVLRILGLLLDSNHHWRIRGYILAATAVLFSGIAWILDYKYKIFSN